MFMKKVFYLVMCLSLVLMSCSKDEVDPRDAYVGTYTQVASGALIAVTSNSTASMPQTGTTTEIVSKVDDYGKMNIGGLDAILSGSILQIRDKYEDIPIPGGKMEVTTSFKGSVAKGLIIINATYSGDIISSYSVKVGSVTGSTTYTLTKK